MILLKKKFLDLVRQGTKRQTIRVWPKKRLRAGQVEFVPGLGRVRITAFEAVRPGDLTDADARLDGFTGRDALLAELRSLYGDRLDDVPCFRIRFSYPVDDEAAPPAPAASGPSG
jgi:hypothetical protein